MKDSQYDELYILGNAKKRRYKAVALRSPVMQFFRILFAVAVLVLLPELVLGFSMDLPVACSDAQTCVVQNYFDHDPSSRFADYRCGSLSYDGHKGTDIRVSYADMTRGVPVLAAFDGTVQSVRDGEPEGEISLRGLKSIRNREAGNGVLLSHADGYETQYSHLRRGSVAVRPGQQIRAGQLLGLVGLSGATEFPHLEISVRRHGQAVDPFTGTGVSQCGGELQPLWSGQAMKSSVLKYRASGLLEAGFFSGPPKDSIALLRRHGWVEGQTADPAVLVFGVQVFGPRDGDEWTLRLTNPNGEVLAESRTLQTGNKAQAMRYVGKKRGAGWVPGSYRGEFRLTRAGQEEVSAVRVIELR